jgi:peptidoglycan hydrolase-like protein with peptidoglycan-binding domain
MNISVDQLAEQVRRARARGWTTVTRKAEKRFELPAGLLLALASRETDMNDIVGDKGHGRGLFQIDDRFHAEWLAAHGAPGQATTPRVADAADFAASMLASNLAFAKQSGVATPDRLRFACSAYNAGPGGALAGHQQGDCDRKTTGRDYGRDVLDRWGAIRGRKDGQNVQMSGDRILRRGDRGKDVAQLKHDLQAWFDHAAPGVWRTFRVQPGPVFGVAMDSAVRDFQMRNALLVDGEAGDDTRSALARAFVPAPSPKPKAKTTATTDGAILRRGSRGPQVARLKRDLKVWFEQALPGRWESFGVAGGPGFGAALERAVRDFQQRNGLLVDGEVGSETFGALAACASSLSFSPLAGALQRLPDLELDSPKKPGSSGQKVRLIQGWLSLHGFELVVDGGYGDATARQVRAFQTANGLPVTGIVDGATYAKLVQPMVAALSPIASDGPLGGLVVAYARQHLVQHPQEVGGENRGPWVRLYTQGREGKDSPWCAGFATFILEQACLAAGAASPFPKTLACDELQMCAGARFLPQPKPSQRKRITPGSLFLRPNPPGSKVRYAHTGIVVKAETDTFKSIEGNTNDDGSAEGFEVCARVHGYRGLDFIII